MKAQYKTAISDARWIAYDIPGNVGWIAYFVCVFRGLREKKDSYNIASALPGVLMLIGVGELISERIAGLDRVLSGKRLFRGFGALADPRVRRGKYPDNGSVLYQISEDPWL